RRLHLGDVVARLGERLAGRERSGLAEVDGRRARIARLCQRSRGEQQNRRAPEHPFVPATTHKLPSNPRQKRPRLSTGHPTVSTPASRNRCSCPLVAGRPGNVHDGGYLAAWKMKGNENSADPPPWGAGNRQVKMRDLMQPVTSPSFRLSCSKTTLVT